MTIHTVSRKNGLDLTGDSVPNLNERVGSWISGNWKWLAAGLLATGYMSLPASTARVDALAAKTDANQQALVQQIAGHEKHLDAVDGALIRIEQKIDNLIQIHINPSLPPPASPPRKIVTPRKTDNGLLGLLNPRR